jgi:hypothetical protein
MAEGRRICKILVGIAQIRRQAGQLEYIVSNWTLMEGVDKLLVFITKS